MKGECVAERPVEECPHRIGKPQELDGVLEAAAEQLGGKGVALPLQRRANQQAVAALKLDQFGRGGHFDLIDGARQVQPVLEFFLIDEGKPRIRLCFLAILLILRLTDALDVLADGVEELFLKLNPALCQRLAGLDIMGTLYETA